MNEITKYKKDTNFHTTLINFIFQFKCNKEEVMALTILAKLLSKTNKKYPEIDLYAREKLNRYILSLNVLSQSINDVYFINYSLHLPSHSIVKEFNIVDSINFLLDSIYDSNIDDKELFEREKRNYIETLLNNYKNVGFIAEKNMLDLLDNDCKFNKIKYKDIDNIKNLTIDDVIQVYNKYIKNIKPKIFIYGNLDKEVVNDTISNYFDKLELKYTNLLKDYNSFYNSNELIDKTELSKYHQSILYMVYNIKDYGVNDFNKLYLINLLLSNPSSDILYDILRKKNNLVYSCGSSIMIRNGLLVIRLTTNKNNLHLCKKLVNSILNDLKNIENYKDNLNKIISRLEDNLKREKDNFFVKPSDIINEYFKADIDSEKVLECLKEYSLDDIKECVNRLEVKCIYTLEGVE